MNSQNNTRKKKPKFLRSDAHKKKRLGLKWRKPKGLHNKKRLHKKGYGSIVKEGYKRAKSTRGFINGLKPVIVSNLSDLQNLDKKNEGIIISSTVGMKKRLDILEEAKKSGLTVLNLNIDKKMDMIKSSLEEKKKEKQKKLEKKEKKVKELEKKKEEKAKKAEKKEEEKEKKTETIDEDSEKEKEKKNLDKLLTKKQ